jgi:hypothetical protein
LLSSLYSVQAVVVVGAYPDFGYDCDLDDFLGGSTRNRVGNDFVLLLSSSWYWYWYGWYDSHFPWEVVLGEKSKEKDWTWTWT